MLWALGGNENRGEVLTSPLSQVVGYARKTRDSKAVKRARRDGPDLIWGNPWIRVYP